MNVTVVGSYRKNNKRLLGSKSNFQKACASIGRKLAEGGHRLIVPHPDNEDTAEVHALRGFQKVMPYHYYACTEQEGDSVLKAHFDAVEKSDAVILIGGLDGTYAAGLSALRRRKLTLPVPMCGGSAKDLCQIPEIDHMLVDRIRNLSLSDKNWEKTLVDSVDKFLKTFPRVLIIHGRGDNGESLSKRLLENSRKHHSLLHGIAKPVIMNLSGMGAISVPDLFEDIASQVSAAIAIVTADDVGGFARGDDKKYVVASALKLMPRARENVWVEVGWFWGRLGRQRIFLWLQDEVELPSDLQGAAWTFSDDINSAWKSIEAFLVKLRSPMNTDTSILDNGTIKSLGEKTTSRIKSRNRNNKSK